MFKLIVWGLLHTTLTVLLTDGALSPTERSYKILMMLPVSSASHRDVHVTLGEALVDRGHQVTMLSNDPLNNSKIEHYHHSLPYFQTDYLNMFEVAKEPSVMFKNLKLISFLIAREIYDEPEVINLYERRDEFDLIIFDSWFNDVMYPFAYKKNFIIIAPMGIDPTHSAVQGNVLNPAYVSNVIFDYKHPYNYWDRLKNILLSIIIPYTWKNSVGAIAQREIAKIFPNLPPLSEIEANQSLSLINSHFSFDSPTPLLPSQIEIGCIHCKDGKPLPRDIDSFLSGDVPVVYMNLGTVVKSSSMPVEHRQIVIDTFANLPYKVIWKFEDDTIDNLPENVMIREWMPQQDILAHPNVQVFITHCGRLSLNEAMYHGTPVVGIPILADQFRNCARMEESGIGIRLDFDLLTMEEFDWSIKEIVNNTRYQNKVSTIAHTFRDQLEDPVDRAVFWTEYVIRHNGAPHLRSPERDLTWVQLLHIDIILPVTAVFYLIVFISLRKVWRYLYSSLQMPVKLKMS